MPKSTDLKERIIQEANTLFMQNGFAGTSIKQIAKAAGCTTAALYYYFEDGKGQILREVIQHHATNMAKNFAILNDAEDLPHLFELLSKASRDMPQMSQRISWILRDRDNLGEEERALVRAQPLQVHQMLTAAISRFIEDETEASTVAWIVFCAHMGYSNIYRGLGPDQTISWPEFSSAFARIIGRGVQ